MGVIIAWAVTLHAGAEDSRCVVTPYLIGKVRLALFAQQEKLMSLEKCLRFARSFSERFRDRLAAAYLFSSAGQLSNKLIALDSARAGVTATNRCPSPPYDLAAYQAPGKPRPCRRRRAAIRFGKGQVSCQRSEPWVGAIIARAPH